MADAALYIHIPFCEKRCRYCDFYTIAGVEGRIPDYIAALKKEVQLRAADAFWHEQRFETIFFGGGTPSLLSPAQISEILRHCFANFQFLPEVEITLETNPGTVTAERLAQYRSIGVNRLSLGVQSFDAGELKMLERIHSPEEAIAAAAAARHAGFENFNLDFMFALPNQTRDLWQATLEQAMKLAPPHLSAYNLTIEAGTPLDFAIRHGELAPLDEEAEREFYAFTIDFLRNHGYHHYEISNFAQPGHEAKHNLKYWDGSFYLGLGASAHAYDGRRRFWNVANLRKYLEASRHNLLAEEGEEELTRSQHMFEFAFLGLRQSHGIDLPAFNERFHQPFEEAFKGVTKELEKVGLLVRARDRLCLSREGLFLCDEICAKLAGACA
ncbi:MAG: radical SAM family heme chaperone HemW [bacterium]